MSHQLFNSQPFIALVHQILAAKKQHTPLSPLIRGELKDTDASALERQIDKMVCDLYGLTPGEIEIVQGKIKMFYCRGDPLGRP